MALIDLTMPDGDGVGLARGLRERFPGLPVLLTSGYDERAAARGGLDGGPTGFLRKPFEIAGLVGRVRELLEVDPVDPDAGSA